MCSSCSKPNNTWYVAAASNLRPILDSICILYKNTEKTPPEIIYGSSSKLAHQIDHQAPFSLFLSADRFYPSKLKEKHPTFSPTAVYSYGRIAIASKTIPSESLMKTLLAGNFSRISIPNPKTAPYGHICVEFLKHLKIYESIKSKLVYGENVLQTQQFIVGNSVNLGITALSVSKSHSDTNYITIPESMHSRLAQHLIVTTPKDLRVLDFVQFLKTSRIQQLFKDNGYGIIE